MQKNDFLKIVTYDLMALMGRFRFFGFAINILQNRIISVFRQEPLTCSYGNPNKPFGEWTLRTDQNTIECSGSESRCAKLQANFVDEILEDFR